MSADLLGRRAEQATVSAFVRASAPGRVLVVRGEPGIGKTELWRFACREADDAGCTVLRATAVASETSLAYCALGDLLAQMTVDGLDRAQHAALAAASARGTGSADVRLVAAGLLNLLTTVSSRGPVVVAVDDVQWLDPSSATALGFALRRLDGEAVRAVVAARAGVELPLQLPEGRTDEIVLGPLSHGAIHHLLNERLGLSLRRPLAYRVHEVSGGNPFYALELAHGIGHDEVNVELPASLQVVVDARIGALPEECLAALRMVAVAEAPTLALVDEVVPGGAASLDAAFDDGLVVLVGHRVRFAHPLYAEGVIAGTVPSELRALHARLADAVRDARVRARHRARAATGPDESLASSLAQEARELLAAGSPAAAARLAGDALALSDGKPPPERVFVAAGAYLNAGQLDEARALLLEHVAELASGDERCRGYLLLARSIGTNGEMLDFSARAVEHARDPALRGEALLVLAAAHAIGFLRELPVQLQRVEEAVGLLRDAGASLDNEVGTPIWVAGLAGIPEPATDLPADGAVTFFDSTERARGLVKLWRGELTVARPIFERGLAHARETGEDESMTSALLQLAELEARAGRVAAASQLAEAAAVGAGDAEGVAMSCRIRAAAQLPAAPPAETLALAERAVELAREGDYVWQELDACRVAGSAALLSGDASTALGWLRFVQTHLDDNGVGNPGVFPVAADLAEALLLAGRPHDAERVVGELEAASREQEHAWGIAAAARASGLLADAAGDHAAAAEALTRSVARATNAGLELDAARARLALGVAHRHAKRRSDARAAFAEAEASFARLGAERFVERTRAESARVAGRRRSDGELTETEHRVAELVASGKTNREVAVALSLSVRGVEANLSRIYAKLGVRSRTELAARFSGPKSVGSHISPEALGS